MKNMFKALYMSFGMFCAIPLPGFWDDSSAKHIMPWLPVVGAVIGAIWWGAAELLVFLGIHNALSAAAIMLIPFMLAGFVHLDGYMDTSDAILSRRPLEEKLRILKDPHTGAFAVIMVAALFIAQFASALAIVDGGVQLMLLPIIPVLSRCCSALAILCIRPMNREGYAALFKPDKAAPHRIMTILIAACALAFAWFFTGAGGLIVAGTVIVGYALAMFCALESFRFKGVSGDLAGFSLVIGELCGIIALAVI